MSLCYNSIFSLHCIFFLNSRSSEDLIHRLFVCIAGVADQLQTNFAADLRNILKAVFLLNQTSEDEPETDEIKEETTIEYQPTEDQVIQNGMGYNIIYLLQFILICFVWTN